MSCDEEYDFTLGDELADITLVVQDKELHVHKAILGKFTRKKIVI